MSISIHRLSELGSGQVSELDHALVAFYTKPPKSYYSIANQAAEQYNTLELPFHCDLVSHIQTNMNVLEIGCGTAHLCPYVERQEAHYTGMDHSTELLENNRLRFPNARFLPIRADLPVTFDFVASLYTIEHLADPPAYLETMWNYCRPGGLLALICPEFVDGDNLPPSLLYGRTSRRLREKFADLDFPDILAHLWDLKWKAPRWLRQARAAAPGAFWINLQPRALYGADYSIDADAVHFARLKDLAWWFEQRGASILNTSRTLPGINPHLLRHNCYILVRKSMA